MKLNNSELKAIKDIKTYIESGPANNETIRELCEITGLNETKLTLGFKFLYQVTIHQYRLAVSMEYARCLLDGDRTVKEVAIMLGYHKQGHFSRAFSKVFGKPPSVFKADKIKQ